MHYQTHTKYFILTSTPPTHHPGGCAFRAEASESSGVLLRASDLALDYRSCARYILDMETISRIWKLKRSGNDDDDDIEYIVGSIIVFLTIIGGYAYHVGF
jgi:hypothetical protein